MPDLLQPAVACKLLLTAAARTLKAVDHLLELQYINQHVNARTLEAMLLQLFKRYRRYVKMSSMDTAVLRRLCSLPAAQQLSSEAAQRLILASLEPRFTRLIPPMFYALPGVQQLSSDQLMQLLAAAVQHSRDYCCEQLCQLPAAKQLGSDQVMQLLAAEPQPRECPFGLGYCFMELCQLQGAQQLSSNQAMQLLAAAVQPRETQIRLSFRARWLCKLPGAQQLSRDQVMQLLKVAVQRPAYEYCTWGLWQLPGAQQLSSDQ
jgi:hypothetical protein